MENNKLFIANLAAPGLASIQIYLQSSEGKKVAPISVGPQSFVQIDSSQVGALPWSLGVNAPTGHLSVAELPAVASLVYNSLTAILYPSA
jgi:hypothetical protein